jgi:hypothetical protein
MRIKQDLPTYNAPIYLRTKCLERKKKCSPNKKKIARSNLVHNLQGEFDPHRHLRRKASVRQYNGAGMILPHFNLSAEHALLTYNGGTY